MPNAAPKRIRVVLRWIQILDIKEAFFKKSGQFRFVSTVSGGQGGPVTTNLPENGHLTVSDSFAQNRITFDTVIFEGAAADDLVVEIQGEEVDRFSKNDPLPLYRREFAGDPSAWLGWYGPGDEEPAEEKENLGDWRVCYVIEDAG